MQNLVSQRDLTAYVEGQGFKVERVFNTTQMEVDGAELRVVGLTLLGPRRNKGFVSLQFGYGDLDTVKLWCEGVNYSTGKIATRKAERAARKRK